MSTPTADHTRNYTGDVLNFGLAKEHYAALHPDKSDRVKFLIVGDDVAVGREQGKIVGRRCVRERLSFLLADPLIGVLLAFASCTRLQAHSLLEEAPSTRSMPSPNTFLPASVQSE